MKTKSHYIKASILSALLVFESYFLTDILMGYVKSGDFFSPSREFFITTVVLLLLILYTYFLTVGGWNKWEQYLLVPLPISTGIGLKAIQTNLTYGLLIWIVVFLILVYDVFLSTGLKNQMIKFNPKMILKFSTRGVLFVFALTTAIFVFIGEPTKETDFDLGEKVGSIAQTQFEKIIQPQLNESAQEIVSQKVPGGGDDFIQGLPQVNLDLKNTVQNEFYKLMEPYKRFIPPLIALVVFTFIRFLGGITNVIFTITVSSIFTFFTKIGFLHVNHKQVQKEVIGFDSETE